MSPPTRNQVTTVPNRLPPSPHSCSWSRSPLRQRAAANPSQVMKPNSTMNTPNAIWFTWPIMCPLRTRIPPASWLVPDHPVDHRREDGAHDDPEQLEPVKKRNADQRRLGLVIEGRPKN